MMIEGVVAAVAGVGATAIGSWRAMRDQEEALREADWRVRDALNAQWHDLGHADFDELAKAQRDMHRAVMAQRLASHEAANAARLDALQVEAAAQKIMHRAMENIWRRPPRAWPWPKRPGWRRVGWALLCLDGRLGDQRQAVAVIRRQSPLLYRLLASPTHR